MRPRFAGHPMLYGMLGGFVWGALLRAWMRLISTDPEFSWGGTGFILGACTIAGTALGVAWLRREHLGRGWWRFLGITALLVGSGAGVVMVPSFLLGAVAFARRGWRPWIRVLLATAAIAIQVAVFIGGPVPAGRALLAYPFYAVMITVEAYAFSVVFRPSREGAPAPGWVQRAAVAVGGIGLAGMAVLIVGVRS